jgi:hypothetical protein
MFHVKHCEPVAFIRNSRLVVSDSHRQEPRNVFPSGHGVRVILSQPATGNPNTYFLPVIALGANPALACHR